MAHVRTQIRDRLVKRDGTGILVGLPTTGNRAYRSRVHPMTAGTMPGICVYCGREKAVGGTLKTTEKAVEIVIDAYAAGPEYDDAVDRIQAEVEAALYGDFADRRFFAGLVTNLSYATAESRYFGEAKVKHGILRMIYEATYKTEDGDGETAL